MNEYLRIAEEALRFAGHPLSARQILGTAFHLEIVPEHLFGRTQHKTLQARLSEDILRNRGRSLFYRTSPGVFFLRELNGIGERRYPEIVARRRARDLRFRDVLSISWDNDGSHSKWRNFHDFAKLIVGSQFFYQDYATTDPASIRIWACSVVEREGYFLSYRQGSYRETRDAFLKPRTIGFYAPVVLSDLDLFSLDDGGVTQAALKIAALDLDVSVSGGWDLSLAVQRLGFLITRSADGGWDALGVIKLAAPPWFDPATQKLSINDVRWLDLATVNHLDDFDPWSYEIFKRLASLSDNEAALANGDSSTEINQ